MEEKKKTQYPLMLADKCPKCGSKKKQMKMTIDELVEDGKLKAGLFSDGAIALQAVLVDRTRPPVLSASLTTSVPVVIASIEICGEEGCGGMWCSKFDMKIQEVPVQMQQVKMEKPPGRS